MPNKATKKNSPDSTVRNVRHGNKVDASQNLTLRHLHDQHRALLAQVTRLVDVVGRLQGQIAEVAGRISQLHG